MKLVVAVFRLGQANLDFTIRTSGLEGKLKISMEDLGMLQQFYFKVVMNGGF